MKREAKMYFIGIAAPAEVNEQVLQWKHYMRDHYGCTVALRSPAHITLIPPFWMEEVLEKELIKDILKYEMVVGEALRTLNPKVIARYSNRIATKFNIFYESVPVLNEQNKEIMIARLTLVNSFAIVLKALFLLLGIEPFKRI